MFTRKLIASSVISFSTMFCSGVVASEISDSCKSPDNTGVKRFISRFFSGESLLPSEIRCQILIERNISEIELDKSYAAKKIDDSVFRKQSEALAQDFSSQQTEVNLLGVEELYQQVSIPTDEIKLETLRNHNTITK